jgi:23S rRNA pseudouridine1911/1915/1917 synthase
MIHENGAPAVTEFRVEKRFVRRGGNQNRFAIVRAIPHSGRTHQIRVHLAYLGHPVAGDKIYGPNEQFYLRFIESGWTLELESELLLPRHALHSARLQLADEFDCRTSLPEDLARFVGDCEREVSKTPISSLRSDSKFESAPHCPRNDPLPE